MTVIGETAKLWAYGIRNSRTGAMAEKNVDGSFVEIAAAKAAGKVAGLGNVEGMSFKDMWQTRFPGAYYHTMDAYKIPQSIWGRLDFPHEEFFNDNVDESVFDWKPTGAEPKMTDPSVQSRYGATLGKKSIVVPPALEEKMKSDPALARRVMAKVESYIAKSDASTPDRISSYVIVLDEEGKIARTCAVSGGGISGSTEAEIRQFEAEQEAKKKRREKYAKLNEASALKRKLMEQEVDERYYKSSIAKEAVSIAAYEKNIMDVAGILK